MTDNTQLYGPNGAEVKALIERAKRLTPDEIRQLAAAWIEDDAWFAAWDAAYTAAEDSVRNTAWAIASDTTRNVIWDDKNARLSGSWHAAMPTTAAALALVVKDLVSQEHFDILYAPWREVIERQTDND